MIQPVPAGATATAAARVVLLALLAGSAALLLGILHRFYARARVPEGLAVLVGLSGVALYLNTTAALGEVIADDTDLLALGSALFNVTAFGLAGLAAAAGGRAGDRLGAPLVALSDRPTADIDVSGLVTAVGRVVTVDIPAEVKDVEGYDPVEPRTKEQLAEATLVFPRRLTVDELRERLVARLKDDYGVGQVDLELTPDGTVTYLAVGAREAGIGPTLPPESCAVAVRADPANAASAGDLVQVYTAGTEPERVATAEVRGTAGDVVTLAVDAADAGKLDGETRYRLVTLPVEPRADREFASLLRSVEETMGVATVDAASALVGRPISAVDAAVVAVRTADGTIEPIPPRSRRIAAGESVYAIARPDRLRRFDEVARAVADDAEATPSTPARTEGR